MLLFTGCPDLLTPPVDDNSLLSEVSNLQTTYTDGTAMLFYEEPSAPDFTGTELTFTPDAAGVSQPITVVKGDGVFSGDIHVIGSDNLTNGTEYTFSLRAVYADGSKSTGLTAAVTPSDIVAAPLNAGASVADGEVILSWDEPAVNNWAFVEINFTPVVGVQPLAVSVGTTSISITGLTNGTEYAFILAATDLFGVYSSDVLISATPSLAGDVAPPANVTGVSSTVTSRGEVYDILQYIANGENSDPDSDNMKPYDYFIGWMNLAGNPTNGVCDVIWTDPVDADYVEAELTLTRDSDNSSQTVTVASGVETYRFTGIVLGESYTLSVRTRDDSNNWSSSQDSAISTSAFNNFTQLDVVADPDGTPIKAWQFDYDHSIAGQVKRDLYVDANSDGTFEEVGSGDTMGCSSYLYEYDSDNKLTKFSSFVDIAQSQIMTMYVFSYNSDMTLQSVSANFDLDGNGLIEGSTGETDLYTYTFNYTGGVLNTIDLNGAWPGYPQIYHQYTLANNIDGNPTQILLYFDTTDGTLDAIPAFKWDFTYDGSNRVNMVEKSSDTTLSGSFTYKGKDEYIYDVSGNLDSVSVYDELGSKQTESDLIY